MGRDLARCPVEISQAVRTRPGDVVDVAAGHPDRWCVPDADTAAVLRPLDDLPCRECGRPLLFDEPNGWVVCGSVQCAAAGMEMPLWRVAQHETVPGRDPNPVDVARPVHRGLPVPWVTVVAAGRPWFRHLHGERLLTCQTRWWCQFCGLPLPARAWLVVTGDGRVVTPAGMHKSCLDIAAQACPHLWGNADLRHIEATPDMILSGGLSLPNVRRPVVWQNWTLARS